MYIFKLHLDNLQYHIVFFMSLFSSNITRFTHTL